MGIVITTAMAFGLIAYGLQTRPIHSLLYTRFAAFSLGLAGLWNVLWYGMQHIEEFWGQAAMISGIVMILAALDLIGTRTLLPKFVIILALLLSFALYAVTLVRLNLGLVILG